LDTTYRLIQGDCLKVLPTLTKESIDLIVTDPPYGLEFMGKDWDRAVPPVDVWRECLRVLKCGAFAFIMSSPRLDCLGQMSMSLQKAGFNVGFTPIYWAYASGFPKAINIGQAVDKRLGIKRDVIGSTGTMPIQTSGKRNSEASANGKFEREENLITQAPSPKAKALDGSYGGFQPKPAVEIIIVAMKPLSEKTYADQALKNQKGITWLDDCRIPIDPNRDDMLREVDRKQRISQTWEQGSGFKNEKNSLTDVREEGRFPANLLVSDNILDNGKETKGNYIEKPSVCDEEANTWGGTVQRNRGERGYDDSGGFSRYFSLDAWWIKRVKKVPKSVQKTFPFLIVPKASKSERNKGLDNLPEKEMPHSTSMKCAKCGLPILCGTGQPTCQCVEKEEVRQKTKNFHPTVKPLKLMSYLITLGSREGDVILDPYVGSGTTLQSAIILNRSCIAVDIEKEYCEIAKAKCFGKNRLDFSEEKYRFEVFEETTREKG
jgi:site-specific DNA-methyltransferase (adenine-specific)